MAEHLGGVVVATEQPLVVEVVELLARVRGNVVREAHADPSPALAVLPPRLDLLDLEAVARNMNGAFM